MEPVLVSVLIVKRHQIKTVLLANYLQRGQGKCTLTKVPSPFHLREQTQNSLWTIRKVNDERHPFPHHQSGLGLQELQEEFVHGHTAVLFDAAEVLDSPSRRLTQEREGHDEFAGPPGVLRVVAGLVVLQGTVEDVLKSLDCLQVLDLHGVCTQRVIQMVRMKTPGDQDYDWGAIILKHL